MAQPTASAVTLLQAEKVCRGVTVSRGPKAASQKIFPSRTSSRLCIRRVGSSLQGLEKGGHAPGGDAAFLRRGPGQGTGVGQGREAGLGGRKNARPVPWGNRPGEYEREAGRRG